MKKILFGAVAWLAVGVTAGALVSPATAEESMSMADEIDFYVEADFLFGAFATDLSEDITNLDADNDAGEAGSDSDTPEYASFALKNGDSEVAFGGRMDLENGMKAVGEAQIDSEGDIDDIYLGLEGGFGELYWGVLDGAAEQLHITAPQVLPGDGIDNDPDFYHLPTNRISARLSGTADQDSEGLKILFKTPRLQGLQLAASYTPSPETDGNNGSGVRAKNNSDAQGTVEEMFSLGANYIYDFSDDVSLGLSIGYLTADAGSAANAADPGVLSLGVRLSLSGFELGGSYYRDNNIFQYQYRSIAGDNSLAIRDAESGDPALVLASGNQELWSVGFSYGEGPWRVGVTYRESTRELEGPALQAGSTVAYELIDIEPENTALEFGASYRLSKGLTVAAHLQVLEDSHVRIIGNGANDSISQLSQRPTSDIESLAGGIMLAISF